MPFGYTETELGQLFLRDTLSREELLEIAATMARGNVRATAESYFQNAYIVVQPPMGLGWIEDIGVVRTLAKHFGLDLEDEWAVLGGWCDREYRHEVETEQRRRAWERRKSTPPRTAKPVDWATVWPGKGFWLPA